MRTIEKIKKEVQYMMALGTQEQIDEVWLEWFRKVAMDIKPDRLEQICNAEREGKLVEALEKQTPKKPNTEYADEFVCPTCGEITEDYDVTTIKYCPECGQRLEWL